LRQLAVTAHTFAAGEQSVPTKVARQFVRRASAAHKR
jgi:hypothetical protein